MSRKFLNIHVLIAISGANPNRDDTGTPKSLRYGGVERSRMSSQALTRAKRLGYE
ncbi:MAG: type I-E CRISPR-associated protein Cas7/Cse4/CasC, partial [Sphingomonas sp.]